MRRSNTTVRGKSIVTGTSSSRGCRLDSGGPLDGDGPKEGGGTTIPRGRGEPVASPLAATFSLDHSRGETGLETDDPDEGDGYEEEAVVFPQSTHSWLFTEEVSSRSFWFAAGIVALSYACLILALINIFDDYDPVNPFDVPYQVENTVRAAQYLAILIAQIMEEEIPTGLYLLRMISKESLQKKFPEIKFWRFVAAAIVRLVMGYLFLFNTFCVVAQANAVLDIFYDVLALQFLQQLDDIAFNIAKVNVFGRHLKRAALSRRFSVEFEKPPFALRRRINFCLRIVFAFNLCMLLGGMGWITNSQNRGQFHAEEITVTFGEQIWREALVKLPSGEVATRALLFSYFNGVYRRKDSNGSTPIYVEQNKYDSSPYGVTIGAEIKFCPEDQVWVFTHANIKKNEDEKFGDERDCPWLLRSPRTTEFNLLDVTGDWSIWTGSIQPDGHFSAMDNRCNDNVDCNLNGFCSKEGRCECTEEIQKLGSAKRAKTYYGAHCEHETPCSLIAGGLGDIWSKENWEAKVRIYQRPVYGAQQGLPGVTLHKYGVNPVEDKIFLMYTGSRWLGVVFSGARTQNLSAGYWTAYAKEFHAFWEDTYTNRTKFASAPTSQSSIIGVDFFNVGRQGKEYGPFGQLFSVSDPPGSGFFKCVEDNPPPPKPAYDVNYQGVTASSNIDGVDAVVSYEIAKGRSYESNVMGRGCATPITGIELNLTAVKSPKNDTHDSLSLKYHFNKSQLSGSNIWNATNGEFEFCQIIRLVFPAVESTPKMVIIEDKQTLSVGF